jgi:hypothetical protein
MTTADYAVVIGGDQSEANAREEAAVALDKVLTERLQEFMHVRNAKALGGISRALAEAAVNGYLKAKRRPPEGDPSCETCG